MYSISVNELIVTQIKQRRRIHLQNQSGGCGFAQTLSQFSSGEFLDIIAVNLASARLQAL